MVANKTCLDNLPQSLQYKIAFEPYWFIFLSPLINILLSIFCNFIESVRDDGTSRMNSRDTVNKTCNNYNGLKYLVFNYNSRIYCLNLCVNIFQFICIFLIANFGDDSLSSWHNYQEFYVYLASSGVLNTIGMKMISQGYNNNQSIISDNIDHNVLIDVDVNMPGDVNSAMTNDVKATVPGDVNSAMTNDVKATVPGDINANKNKHDWKEYTLVILMLSFVPIIITHIIAMSCAIYIWLFLILVIFLVLWHKLFMYLFDGIYKSDGVRDSYRIKNEINNHTSYKINNEIYHSVDDRITYEKSDDKITRNINDRINNYCTCYAFTCLLIYKTFTIGFYTLLLQNFLHYAVLYYGTGLDDNGYVGILTVQFNMRTTSCFIEMMNLDTSHNLRQFILFLGLI